MGIDKTDETAEEKAAYEAERTIRGAALDGSERSNAVDHTAYKKNSNPDTILRLDGEEDTLYDDGLELEDDSAPLTGKDGRDDTH